MCRQALCEDSNYPALLGLIRLPLLDALARGKGGGVGAEVGVDGGGGEREGGRGVAALRYGAKDKKQGVLRLHELKST